MRGKLLLGLVSLVAVPMLLSCDSSSVFDSSIRIPNDTWSAEDVARFDVPIDDTLSYHNLYINLRNTTSYPNQNIYFFITTYAPNGAMLRDTLEGFLADDKGAWLGKGFGRLRDNRLPYRQGVRFSGRGVYRFEVQQAMRTQKLEGIANVGIRVERAGQSR